MKKIALGAGAAVLTLGALLGMGQAHATPNADRIEEEGVCEILDSWTGSSGSADIRTALGMAVVGVQTDTGMNQSDSAPFVAQSINDLCPTYKKYLFSS
jgi:hypothetical protein